MSKEKEQSIFNKVELYKVLNELKLSDKKIIVNPNKFCISDPKLENRILNLTCDEAKIFKYIIKKSKLDKVDNTCPFIKYALAMEDIVSKKEVTEEVNTTEYKTAKEVKDAKKSNPIWLDRGTRERIPDVTYIDVDEFNTYIKNFITTIINTDTSKTTEELITNYSPQDAKKKKTLDDLIKRYNLHDFNGINDELSLHIYLNLNIELPPSLTPPKIKQDGNNMILSIPNIIKDITTSTQNDISKVNEELQFSNLELNKKIEFDISNKSIYTINKLRMINLSDEFKKNIQQTFIKAFLPIVINRQRLLLIIILFYLVIKINNDVCAFNYELKEGSETKIKKKIYIYDICVNNKKICDSKNVEDYKLFKLKDSLLKDTLKDAFEEDLINDLKITTT